jgi:putative endonuclease
MPSPSHTFGQSAEDMAEQMLRKKGYRILERNFRVAGGELDLIADDQGILVFIEVKARRGQHFGGAPYAITTRKKQQIIKLASCYLSQRDLINQNCRFDAILVVGTNEHPPQVTHIEQAFEVSSSAWQW